MIESHPRRSAALPMLRSPRSIHRALVPIAAVPLLLTVVSGVLFSLLAQRGVELEWLLQIHTGHYGALNLSSIYPTLLGLCLLVLILTGLSLWLQSRRRPRPS